MITAKDFDLQGCIFIVLMEASGNNIYNRGGVHILKGHKTKLSTANSTGT